MLWGLTGCSGSGATAVATVWGKMGADVCSLDSIGHGFLSRSSVKNQLEKRLGIPGLSSMPVSSIRSALRELAFTDQEVLKGINGVLHTRLRRWTSVSAGILSGKPGVYVLDAALVFELELENILDFTVAVKDSRERSLKRLSNRDGIGSDAAAGRWRNQIDIGEKCRRSNFVIDNSGTLEELTFNAEYFYNNVIVRMEDATWHTRQERN